MLCHIETTKSETRVKEGDVFLFTPPQTERETIQQIIEVMQLVQAINVHNITAYEPMVRDWMHPSLSLEEATIRVEVKNGQSLTEVKNTAFIINGYKIPDNRFDIKKPSGNSLLGSDTATTRSASSTLSLLEARARPLAEYLLEGRVLAGHEKEGNEAVLALPKDKESGHRVGIKQLDITLKLMASQLDEVLCEIKDFMYQGTFASRKQSLTLAKYVAEAAKVAGVDGVIRSYDVRSVDIQFSDRDDSISFVETLDQIFPKGFRIKALTRCLIRVENLTAAEIAAIINEEKEDA